MKIKLRQAESLKHAKVIAEGIATAYKFALFSGHNQNQLLENIELARTRLLHYKLTNFASGYLSAHTDILYSDFQKHLEFCYEYNGELYSTHKDSMKKKTEYLHTLEPRLTQAQWDALPRGLYYKTSSYKFY